jgi:transposase-like protein
MNVTPTACPYCGSSDLRLVTDARGSVGWCRTCHRTWETARETVRAQLLAATVRRPVLISPATAGEK